MGILNSLHHLDKEDLRIEIAVAEVPYAEKGAEP